MTRLTGFATLVAFGLVGTLAVAGATPPAQEAAEPAPAVQQDHQRDQQAPQAADQPAGPDMGAMHQKMMADLQASNARLAELLAKAKGAKGETKVNALTDLVAEFVQQRQLMHQQMVQGGMATCPMMQGMGGMQGASEGMSAMHQGDSGCGMM